MEAWINSKFVIINGEFKSMEIPESWTQLEGFLSVFGNCIPTYESLMLQVGNTGFQYIFDDWNTRGLFN